MRLNAALAALALLTAATTRADEPLAALALKGKEHAAARLVAIRAAAAAQDPLAARALAAAFARLEADPESGFSAAEKVVILQALADHREPAGAPCACRALRDPSREVRRAALHLLETLRDPQAVPGLIVLLEEMEAGQAIHAAADLAVARQASDLLEILANHSLHFLALSGSGERQIAVTRWRQWWEAHKGEPRSRWQADGFKEHNVETAVPADAASVPALIEALAPAKPAWIRENAWELLAALPCAPPGGTQAAAAAALAKGLDHADADVRARVASALFRALAAAGHADLPAPAGKDLPTALKAWWGSHGGA